MPTLQEIQREVLPPIAELEREHRRMQREMDNPALLPIVAPDPTIRKLAQKVLEREMSRIAIANCRDAYVRIHGRYRRQRKGVA